MDVETKIIIADDHPIFRRGLKQVIEDESNLKIIGEAENGIAALELIEKLSPDIAVIDGHMPKMGGLELARVIKTKNLLINLIFLTMYKDETMFNEAMDAGVKGYVLKDNAVSDIVTCIKSIKNGEPFITSPLLQFLMNRGSRAKSSARENHVLQALTKTEKLILQLIAEEKTSKEIGELLFIHPRTVDNHRTNICAKLDIHGSNALLRFALTHKSDLNN